MLSLPLKPPFCSTPLDFQTLYSPKIKCCKSQIQTERGHSFDTGDSFFRHESSSGRDLGVLSAAVYKKTHNVLRVLDAMCGCGIRSLRYLAEADADFVLANDANPDYGGIISGNLEKAGVSEERWVVKHLEANRLLTECYLERDYFDLIDVDSFGSESSYLRSAMCSVKMDGLLYVTSTDGYSSGGHRPQHGGNWQMVDEFPLEHVWREVIEIKIMTDPPTTRKKDDIPAAYGAYVKPMPYSNEIGLRMLIGGALREASVLGYHVVPLFSCYSYHGPVFRAMLQVKRGKFSIKRHYGFISYCIQCGNSRSFSWDELDQMRCSCNNVPGSLVVSGPLWTGPLHNTSFLTEMQNLAEEWGWIGNGTGKHMATLLKIMIDESDPALPFGYLKVNEISSRAKINSPPLDSLLHALRKEGYAASRSHIVSNAIKTNCPMVDCVRFAKELRPSPVTTNQNFDSIIEA